MRLSLTNSLSKLSVQLTYLFGVPGLHLECEKEKCLFSPNV